MGLCDKKCVPCEGRTPPITAEKIAELLPSVPGWTLTFGMLHREMKLKNFKEAVDLFNKIADLAEENGHHPDLTIYRWNKLKIVFYTHAINGLSENDFIMAAKVNRLVDTV